MLGPLAQDTSSICTEPSLFISGLLSVTDFMLTYITVTSPSYQKQLNKRAVLSDKALVSRQLQQNTELNHKQKYPHETAAVHTLTCKYT